MFCNGLVCVFDLKVMMMVAFHVELIIAPGISVIVTVVPRTGFNMFLLAVLMSLGACRFVMCCDVLYCVVMYCVVFYCIVLC